MFPTLVAGSAKEALRFGDHALTGEGGVDVQHQRHDREAFGSVPLAPQVLLRPEHRVFRAWLDGRTARAVHVARHGLEHAEREAAGGAARQLRRPRDRRRRRRARVPVVIQQRRAPSDAARVEEPLVGAAVDDDVAVQLELVEPRPLDEERAALVQERLERGEVHDRRIGLDRTKVRIDRRVERKVGAKAHLEVRACASAKLVGEWTQWTDVGTIGDVGCDIWKELDPPCRRDSMDSLETAKP